MKKTTSRKYRGNKIQAAKPLKMRISKSKPIFRVRVMVLNATYFLMPLNATIFHLHVVVSFIG